MVSTARETIAVVLTYVLSAPVLAVLTVAVIAFTVVPVNWPNLGWAGLAVIFLGVVPLLGYVLPAVIRRTAGDKRVQRLVSFVVNLVSYPVGALVLLVGRAPSVLTAVAFSYVATVVILALVNLFYKASGHASGVAGPVMAFFILYGLWALPSLVLLPLVAWARVQVKGHTWPQVAAGAVIAAGATWGAFSLLM